MLGKVVSCMQSFDIPPPLRNPQPVTKKWALDLRHFLAAKSLQSCPTLSDPMDCSPPGSSVHGIFQARVLEWGAIAFSANTSLPRDKKPSQSMLGLSPCVRISFHITSLTSWQIDAEIVETMADFIFLGSKITADGDYSHEIKRRLLLGRKVMTNLDSIFLSETSLCQQSSV